MESREVYFDNSATTQCSRLVVDTVTDAMTGTYGNPSSQHLKGVEAERIVRGAREKIAKSIRAGEKEIFFTSGGTESDNWALIGGAAAMQRYGTHLITTSIEHPAVLQTMQQLESRGFTVTYLPVDSKGFISLSDLEAALREDTVLVSIMHVNNEVGSIQPIEEAAELVRARSPHALIHTDAVQSYGKIPISVRKVPVDMLSVSAHKIHGPKGVGFLYVREKTKLLPYIYGGGQQTGMRSGTENVPGIAGLGAAAEDACTNLDAYTASMRQVRDALLAGLRQMDGVVLHSSDDERSAPHIVSASFVGVRSEVLLHALEDRGIYVSAGSACASNRKHTASPVLAQLNLPGDQLESTLRFSFSHLNTVEEVKYCLETLEEYLPVLRRYTRR